MDRNNSPRCKPRSAGGDAGAVAQQYRPVTGLKSSESSLPLPRSRSPLTLAYATGAAKTILPNHRHLGREARRQSAAPPRPQRNAIGRLGMGIWLVSFIVFSYAFVATRQFGLYWRRGRDSNPRSPARGTTVFETAPFDRSGTSPSRGVSDLAQRRWEQQENPRPEHWTDWQTGQRACSKDLSGDGFIDDHELDLCDPHHIVHPNPRLFVDRLGVCADYQPPAVAAPFVRHRQESG